MIEYIKVIFCLFAIQINVQAQISNTKVVALVEALRLAAPDGNLIECKMGAVLQDVNDMSITVRRAVAWWMTGNSNDYNKASVKNYTLKGLEFYNNLK
ncbi:MAG TPA: hypothetical protein ENK59_01040 [Thioploca sp.]|nr:hypothetical protein [Thioploca sp.]